MSHQMTLEELGIIPRQVGRSQYACFCGGCICNHCANSVECIDNCTGEAVFGCFTCDDCKGWDGKGTDNWKSQCSNYKVTEAYAKRVRKNFKVIKK